jgi:DNA topoisomerase-1
LKVNILKYELKLVKKALLAEDPKLKKKHPGLVEPESDFEDDVIKETEKAINDLDVEKYRKKLEKDNEKAKASGGDAASTNGSSKGKKRKASSKKGGNDDDEDDEDEEASVAAGGEVKSKEQIEIEVKEYSKIKSTDKIKKRTKDLSQDKLEKKYEQLVEKVRAQKVLMIDKEEGKTTALGTSKINYIDPRISVAWCLKYEVPIDKIFNGTLREKFRWAIESVDEDWVS